MEETAYTSNGLSNKRKKQTKINNKNRTREANKSIKEWKLENKWRKQNTQVTLEQRGKKQANKKANKNKREAAKT